MCRSTDSPKFAKRFFGRDRNAVRLKIALSHETALAVYGISDANPSSDPSDRSQFGSFEKEAPLRRLSFITRISLPDEITIVEGLPVTTIARTITISYSRAAASI